MYVYVFFFSFSNDIVGQDVVKIKISCSPGRDREREENRYHDYQQKVKKHPVKRTLSHFVIE